MELAALPTTLEAPRRLLLRARPRLAAASAEAHLHFDRDARVWRTHEQHQPPRVEMAFPECA